MTAQHDDTQQRVQLLNLLATNYKATLSKEDITLWLMMLADYPLPAVRRAVTGLVRKYGSEAVPFNSLPPFALMQRELDRVTGGMGEKENLALMAESEWGRLLDLCESVGSYGSPKMHPTTAYVVRQMGGWANVCRWREDELQWRHRDFVERWQQCHGREEIMELGADEVKKLATSSGGMKSLSDRLSQHRLLTGQGRIAHLGATQSDEKQIFDTGEG